MGWLEAGVANGCFLVHAPRPLVEASIETAEQLRTAHDLLTRIGVEAFAERARRELQATGETALTEPGHRVDTPIATQVPDDRRVVPCTNERKRQ